MYFIIIETSNEREGIYNMPYCPKCDMEFVEGITVCSDCGGPLMDMEEALRMKEEKKLQQEQEKLLRQQEALLLNKAFESEEGDASEEDMAALSYGSTAQESKKEAAKAKEQAKAYVPKRQRYEDMKSSISAFFMLGGVFLVFGILCLANIINLPLDKGPAMIFEIVLTAMGAACLLVAAATKKSADRMIHEASAEEIRTKELITWYTENFTGKEIDETLLKEDPTLADNELYLKRFEFIQDRLITSHDLPDASYVDYLSEDIYAKLFETT